MKGLYRLDEAWCTAFVTNPMTAAALSENQHNANTRRLLEEVVLAEAAEATSRAMTDEEKDEDASAAGLEALLQKAELGGKTDPTALFQLSEALLKAGNREGARKAMAAIVENSPKYMWTVLGTPRTASTPKVRVEARDLLAHVAAQAGHEVKRMTGAVLRSAANPDGVYIPAFESGNGRLVCAGCGANGAEQRCSRCKAVNYCGRACQMKDWKSGHREECAKIQARIQASKPKTFKFVVENRPGNRPSSMLSYATAGAVVRQTYLDKPAPTEGPYYTDEELMALPPSKESVFDLRERARAATGATAARLFVAAATHTASFDPTAATALSLFKLGEEIEYGNIRDARAAADVYAMSLDHESKRNDYDKRANQENTLINALGVAYKKAARFADAEALYKKILAAPSDHETFVPDAFVYEPEPALETISSNEITLGNFGPLYEQWGNRDGVTIHDRGAAFYQDIIDNGPPPTMSDDEFIVAKFKVAAFDFLGLYLQKIGRDEAAAECVAAMDAFLKSAEALPFHEKFPEFTVSDARCSKNGKVLASHDADESDAGVCVD